MSHERKDKQIENPTPLQTRAEMEKYFQHVLSHDPQALRFVMMVAGHEESNGDLHTCTLVGGPPQLLAETVMNTIDELIKREPSFAAFFLINMLARAKNIGMIGVELIDATKLDSAGGADIEERVKEMLSKIGGNKPPSGSMH